MCALTSQADQGIKFILSISKHFPNPNHFHCFLIFGVKILQDKIYSFRGKNQLSESHSLYDTKQAILPSRSSLQKLG